MPPSLLVHLTVAQQDYLSLPHEKVQKSQSLLLSGKRHPQGHTKSPNTISIQESKSKILIHFHLLLVSLREA